MKNWVFKQGNFENDEMDHNNAIQEELISQKNKKRNLAWNCPTNTKVYPMIFGMEQTTDCNGDVNLQGFDVDDSGNLLIAGTIVSSTATSCPTLSNSQSGSRAFMTLQDQNGQTIWHSVSSAGTIMEKVECANFYLSSILGVITQYTVTNQQIGVFKAASATGITSLEKLLNFPSTSSTQFDQVNTRIDPSDGSLCIFITMKTTYFQTTQLLEGLMVKFDVNLALKWTIRRTVSASGAVKKFGFQDIAFTTSNAAIVAGSTYTNIQRYFFIKIDKNTGLDSKELRICGASQPSMFTIRVAINFNETIFASHHNWDSIEINGIVSGYVSNTTFINGWFTQAYCKQTHEIAFDSDGYIHVFFQRPENYLVHMKTHPITGATTIQTGHTRFATTGSIFQKNIPIIKGNDLYIGISLTNYLTSSYKQRGLIIKTNINLDTQDLNCLNNTNFGHGWAGWGSYPEYTLTQSPETQVITNATWSTVATVSMAPVSQALVDKIYNMQDTYVDPGCALPYSATPAVSKYYFDTDLGNTVTYGPVSITQCDGRAYKITNTAMLKADGTTDASGKFAFNTADNTFTASLAAADSTAYTGSRFFRFTGKFGESIAKTFVRLDVEPLSTLVRDPTAPIHDISTCDDNFYPLLYGQTFMVWIEYGTLDEYGNMLFVGSSKKQPFALTNNTGQLSGFVTLQDMRGNPYWIYTLQGVIALQTVCYYASQYQTFVYASCNVLSQYYSNLGQLPMILKINHKTGSLIYSKMMPLDQVATIIQDAQFVKRLANDQVLAIYKYKIGGMTTFAAINFNEITFTETWYKYYPLPAIVAAGPQDQSFIIDETSGYFYAIQNYGTSGYLLNQIQISDGQSLRYSRITDISNNNQVTIDTTLYSTNKLIMPYFNYNNPEWVTLYIVLRSDITLVTQRRITFGATASSTTLVISTDSSDNIYISMGSAQVRFVKLDSSFVITNQKIWTAGGFTNFNAMSMGIYNDQIIFFLSGIYTSVSAGIIFRADTNLNFKNLCVKIIDMVSGDGFFASISTPASTYAITQLIGGVDGIRPINNMLLITDMSYFTYNTFSYSDLISNRMNWGEEINPNQFQAYPTNTKYCQSIAVSRTFIDANTYELEMGTGQQDIVLTQPTSCQGRSHKLSVLSPYTDVVSTTLQYTWLTWDSNQTIQVQTTGGPLYPITFHVRVRYYDEENINYWYDHFIRIRIINATNVTLTTGTCSGFNLYTMSYGGECATNCDFFVKGFFVNTADYNIIIGGAFNSGNVNQTTDDVNDAFVMRTNNQGNLQWFTSLSSFQTIEEYVTGVAVQNDMVYAMFYTNVAALTSRVFAIIKLTYNEGKIIYSRRLYQRNLLSTTAISFYEGYKLVPDIANLNRFSTATVNNIPGTGYIVTYTMFEDNGGLDIMNQVQIKPAAQASNINYHGGGVYDSTGVYFTGLSFVTSGSYYDLIVVKMDSLTGSVLWNFRHQDSQPHTPRQMNPDIALSGFNQNLYIVSAITPATQSEFIRLSNSGSCLQKAVIQSGGFSNQGIAIDSLTGNIYITGMIFSSTLYIIRLNYLLTAASYMINLPHSQTTANNQHHMIFATPEGMYLASVQNSHAYYFNSNTIVINKLEYFTGNTVGLDYECHTWSTYSTGYGGLISSPACTSLTIPPSYIVSSGPNYMVTLDYAFIRAYQLQQYGKANMYPGSDIYAQSYATGTTIPCAYNAVQYPIQNIAFPTDIELTMGETYDIVFDPTSDFSQCQGITVRVWVVDEVNMFDRNANNSWIVTNSTTISIDTSVPGIAPGFRMLRIDACADTVLTKCRNNYVTLTIWPLNMINATTTEQVSTCVGKQFPKVLGHQSATSQVYITKSDVDQSNGNILICGNSEISQHASSQNDENRNWVVILGLLNNLGIPMWIYNIQYFDNRPSRPQTIISDCLIGAENDIYSLIKVQATPAPQSFLIRQNQQRGKILFISKIIEQQTFGYLQLITQNPISKSIYFSGLRSDVSTAYWYLARIDPSLTFSTRIWSTSSNLIGSAQTDPFNRGITVSKFSDSVFTSSYSWISAHNCFYFTLTKFSASTGAWQGSRMLTPIAANVITINSVALGILSDSSGNIYTSYGKNDLTSPQTNYFYVSKWSDALAKLAGVQFTLANPYNGSPFFFDLELSSTVLYSMFSTYQDYIFINLHSTTTLLVSSSYRIYTSSAQHLHPSINLYNNYFIVTFSGAYYLTSLRSGIIDKIPISFATTESCFTWSFQGLTTSVDSSTFDYGNLLSFSVNSTSYVLNSTSGIYGELISHSLGTFGLGSASTWSSACTIKNPPLLSELHENQKITLPVASPVTYTFNWATICDSTPVFMTWSVDKYTTIPTFLTLQSSGTSSTLSMQPVVADIGTYTIRVRYTSAVDSTNYLDTTFLVDVYPATPFGNPTTTECASSIWPIFLQSALADTYVYTADVDSTESLFVVCGRQQTSHAISGGVSINTTFIQTYNKNFILNFHHTLEIGSTFSFAAYCQFGESNFVYGIYTGKLGSYFDATVFYKVNGLTGQFENGKQLYVPGSNLFVREQIVQSNGDQLATSEHQSAEIGDGTTNVQNIVIRLDKDLALKYFKSFSYTNLMTNRGLVIDIPSNSIYYAGLINYGGLNSLAVFKSDYDSCTLSWGQTIYNASYFSPGASWKLGLAYGNGHAYSLTNFQITHPSYSGYELHVTQHSPTTGAKIANVELSTVAITHTEIKYSNISNRLIVFMAQSQYATILIFDVNPLELKRRQLIFTASTADFYHLRVALRGSTSYLITSFIQGQLATLQFSKLVDNGDIDFYFRENCTYNGFQYMETGTPMDLYKVTNLGVFYDHGSLWTPVTIVGKTVPQVIVNKYFTNPSQVRAKVLNVPTADFKFKWGTCSPLSSPLPPVVFNRTSNVTNGTNLGGFKVGQTYTYTVSAFTQCQGLTFTINSLIAPQTVLPSTIVFNATSRVFTISPTLNSQAGVFTIRYFANLTSAPSVSNYSDFQLEILANEPPYALENFNNSVNMYAWHNFSWAIELDQDLENDIATFAAQIETSSNVPLSPQPAWFQVTLSDTQGMQFSVVQPPQPLPLSSASTLYYIRVKASDSYNSATPRSYLIALTVNRNKAPSMTQVFNQTIGSYTVPEGFSYTLWYQNFTDAEGDQVIINCNTNTTTSSGSAWIIEEQNVTQVGNITLYGTCPTNNIYAGLYTINCAVKDEYDGIPNVYQMLLTMNPKPSVVISGTPGDQHQRLPFNTFLNMSQYSYDSISYAFTVKLFINNTQFDNTTSLGDWIFWDETCQNLTVNAFNNSQGGNHSICLKYEDAISTPVYLNFTYEVIYNFPLIALETLPIIGAIVDNPFLFHFNKTKLFQDPESQPYIMYIRQANSGNNLPYFISKNYSNGSISGFATENNIGNWLLECVGVDDSFQETVIPFQLIVKPCYFKCLTCWESDYNTCLYCKDDFYLYGTECLEKCISGTFHYVPTLRCLPCPYQCRTCFGNSSTTECNICNIGYFQIGLGCYDKCPVGYWGDLTDYKCKVCNSACTDCYGPQTTQCTKCAEIFGKSALNEPIRTGYLRIETECKLPKCVNGQYFDWYQDSLTGEYKGQCKNCHQTCKQCTGALTTQCVECFPGSIYDQLLHTCQKCEEIIGLFTNEELECEDRCGDGIVVLKQCDDGNTISGDGCSGTCYLEYGYECKTPNTTCREIIPPDIKVDMVTEINLIYVRFSEPITITSKQVFTSDNLQIEIIGPLGTYVFKWRVIEDPNNPLVPDRRIEKFQIKLSDMEQSLDGTEIVKISFKDVEQVKDTANNTIVNGTYVEINPAPFLYISPQEATAVNGTGTSLKYTFISVFSFNIALKMIMNSSMQYLWGLVHALQVFNFLLLLNIDFPENVESFSGYLGIASGDLEEFNQFIPSMSSYLITEDDIVDQYDNERHKQKFQDADIPPYFIMAFGQKLTMWGIGFLIVLPIALVMNKICKKVQFWEELISSFFFNGPLRTFIEMYIELVLQVVINTEFIKFSNFSQIVATAFVFIFGAISLLLPFMTMSLIYEGRKNIRKMDWMGKFGMLTEELRGRSILQLYFYPLFMYQRLMIAGIIVYVYEYPLIQCLLVIVCNIAMITYLIIVRPFKEENLQTTTVLDEFVIMLCVCLFLVMYAKEMTPDEKKGLGWGVIMLILFSVGKNFGVVIYFGFLSSRQRLREMFSAEDEQKDSPNSSDQDSDSLESVNTEEALEEIHKEQQQDNQWQSQFNTHLSKKSLSRRNHLIASSNQNLLNNVTNY